MDVVTRLAFQGVFNIVQDFFGFRKVDQIDAVEKSTRYLSAKASAPYSIKIAEELSWPWLPCVLVEPSLTMV
jgi:hypothetical protein